MAWRLPLTVLVAPLLYIPGIAWAGNKVYRWVARNRFRRVPCVDVYRGHDNSTRKSG